MKQQVPVDNKRKDWPRLAAEGINKSQERTDKLDSFSANTTAGLLVQTSDVETIARTLEAAPSNKIVITDGDGVADNPTFDIAIFGFTAGDGGSVTQATSKATGVTLNEKCGRITMNAANLVTATSVSFTLTNSEIGANDVIAINHSSGGTFGAYAINAQAGSGSATINVRNLTAGDLAEAIVLGFAVIKGVVT